MAGDWTSVSGIESPRVLRALAWGDKMTAIVNGATDETWDALLPMIDADRFVRRGNERTELRWPAYRKLLEQWQDHSGKYEKELHRASEVGNVVYLDLDERATAKDGSVGSLRSIRSTNLTMRITSSRSTSSWDSTSRSDGEVMSAVTWAAV